MNTLPHHRPYVPQGRGYLAARSLMLAADEVAREDQLGRPVIEWRSADAFHFMTQACELPTVDLRLRVYE